MYAWLRCWVSPGQFSDEYAVTSQHSDGTIFSLFSPKEYVRCDPPPREDERVDGLIRVRICEREEDQVIVRLPQQILEGGYFAQVRADQLVTATQEQLIS